MRRATTRSTSLPGSHPEEPGSGEDSSRASLVALGLVVGLLGLLALRQISSHDMGFHLTAGNWILDGTPRPSFRSR